MSSELNNSLLGQHFKLQFFNLWRKLALKQRKKYIKDEKSCFLILRLYFL